MITRDGGMKITIQAKLIELGGSEGQPLATFQVAGKQTFTLPFSMDELREVAPLLYSDLEIEVSVRPKR